MKKQLFALIGLGVLLATVSAYAQSAKLKADVPFEFVVAGRTMPKGEYTIRALDAIDHALSISGKGQNASIFLANSCISLKPVQTELVFHRYGDQYFLSEIWTAGNEAGYQLPKSRREAEVEMARKDTAEKVMVLAGLR
jgi:hypothetical protein